MHVCFVTDCQDISEIAVKCEHIDKGCEWTGTIGTLDKHLTKKCKFAEFTCKFKSLGCSVMGSRKRIREHEEADNDSHLQLSLATITTMRTSWESHSGLSFKMIKFNEKKEKKETFRSESFYTNLGYKMEIEVSFSKTGRTHLSVFARMLHGTSDDELSWPFKGEVTILLLNQLADEEHLETNIEFETNQCAHPGGGGWGKKRFISFSDLSHDEVKNVQYLKNDTLYFRVLVQEDKYWLTGRNSSLLSF